MNKLKADQEGRIRLRCHFSIIIESVWQFWLVILIFLFNQIDEVLDFIRSLDNGTLREFMAGGGLIGLLAILALTLLVFLWQFLRWRKTLITLDGNLIIIERNTLNKKKSTIAIENVSAVNMERNLFERIAGTYRLKLDTNSMTTANKTDVSIVLREDVALAFRQLIIARMNILKGGQGQMAEERQPDKLTQAAREGIRVLHCGKNDMLKHMLYTLPLLSVLVVVAGTGRGHIFQRQIRLRHLSASGGRRLYRRRIDGAWQHVQYREKIFPLLRFYGIQRRQGSACELRADQAAQLYDSRG